MFPTTICRLLSLADVVGLIYPRYNLYCREYRGRRYELGVEFKMDFVCNRKRGSIKDAGVTVTLSMGLVVLLLYPLLSTVTIVIPYCTQRVPGPLKAE